MKPPPPMPVRPAARIPASKVGPDDPRYADLVRRGFNRRFTGRPEYVHLVSTTTQVVEAVQEAVRARLRLAVRSGGHCLEGFVSDPAVQVVIDTSLMTGVYYDPDMGAFAVECGATLAEVYRKLYLGWGVALPAGVSPNIGIGGHVLGGAFGFLCRLHGLAADHLYAVEVVVVDERGAAQAVVATRQPSDPNRELWWAHTGGGGGNFGIVTRYWFRSPGTLGGDPTELLPRAPAAMLRFKSGWAWEDLDPAAFSRLLRNHGAWSEANSAPGSPNTPLYSTLVVPRRSYGEPALTGVLADGAERLLAGYLSAVNEGLDLPFTHTVEQTTWLGFALYPFPDLVDSASVGGTFKIKDAFLRRRLSDAQIDLAYHYLTRTDCTVPGGMLGGLLGMATYGGQVNCVAPDATASAQRDSIFTLSCSVGWADPQDEATNLLWVRQFYRDLFAATGGVPAPGTGTDGAFINHPDVDLADPQWNTSGIPWHRLYYKDNYPRLQAVKARWDPRNVFHHALSIRPG